MPEGGVPGGMTAMHCACSEGHDAVVRLLLLAAPYASLVLDAIANRLGDRGPAETPRELAARLDSSGIGLGGTKWRKCIVAIDQAVDDDRERAQMMLGEGLTLLSEECVEEAMQRSRYGLKCEPGNVELQSLMNTAVGMLVEEMEEDLHTGNALSAFHLARSRLALAPEVPEFSRLFKKTELLAAKQQAADARVRLVGSSLVEYERTATKMVGDALAHREEALQEAQAAYTHADTMNAWETKANALEEVNYRTQGLWQARAIRKMRQGGVQKCIASWCEYTRTSRVHSKALRRCGAKYLRRNLWIVWHGWKKFLQMQKVAGAQAHAAHERSLAFDAVQKRETAEYEFQLAKERASHAQLKQMEAEAAAAAAEAARARQQEVAEACEASERKERDRREAVERTQQDTRNAWIAEKKRRETIEASASAQFMELEAVKAELATTQVELAQLRRQAIASRYDAWSGRKIGVLPKLRKGGGAVQQNDSSVRASGLLL